jgi:hypothetical protein
LGRNLPLEAAKAANFQYEQALWNGVWLAVGTVLGLLFGIKK